jgi:hypothetical protein
VFLASVIVGTCYKRTHTLKKFTKNMVRHVPKVTLQFFQNSTSCEFKHKHYLQQ